MDHMDQEGHRDQYLLDLQLILLLLCCPLVPVVQFQVPPWLLSLQEVQGSHPVPGSLGCRQDQDLQELPCSLLTQWVLGGHLSLVVHHIP